MKKVILLSMLMFIPLGIIAQEMKIAVVNTQTVFMAMPEISKFETELANITKQYEAEYKGMQDEHNREYSDFVAQQDTLTENIKVLRLQKIQDIRNRMENFAPMAEEYISKEREKLFAPIQQKVDKAIKEVGTENGYTYILIDNPQIILFKGSSAIDATDKVKAKLGIK
ncbi:MAG: OmpH family outer membrane protein [Tannerella sp.]|jgi:outer membrane protein|nr:OmpH family outer membrane protein [Tannerella sp.]